MYKHPFANAVSTRHWYQRPVTWAFGFLLALIALITLLAIFSLQRIEKEFFQETLVKIEKLRLLDEMVHHSRQRSVLLRDLVIARDPFDQDEINQKHSTLATRYLLARTALAEQPLNNDEQNILNRIIELNSSAYETQQKIIELATSGAQEEALQLIEDKLAPNREQIYPDLMYMREMLVSSSTDSTQSALQLIEQYRTALIWLMLVAMITGLGIVWLASRMDSRHTRRLLWQACHDPLTGVGNRYEAETQLVSLVEDASEHNARHGLIYLDIDQFNFINNTSGQAAGDEFLRYLAMSLNDTIENGNTIHRVGSDQFIILLKNKPLEEVKLYAQQLLKKISRNRFVWSDKSYDITASIGIVPVTAHSNSPESLLSDAYLACDIAKERGGDRTQVSIESSRETRERREGMDWKSRLRHAMKEDRLVLFSQGIKSLKNGKAHSEILIRYQEDDGEFVPAARFIPAAERYNLITEIDLYVVRKTLDYMAAFNSDHSYSINLSGMSLGDRELLELVVSKIDSGGIDPERICFEITETAAIRNHTAAVQFMNVLHGLGCHFFLDDFGSGLSSFGYLKTLPLDFIKIDAHFIRHIEEDEANLSIIEAIHKIAHGFGMKTVAEGVENEKQLDILRTIGIDFVQGYLIERPARLLAA